VKLLGVCRVRAAVVHGWKRWFLRFWFFYGFLKNQKISKGGFFGFYGFFLDIVVFYMNYALKPYSYYFFIIT